MTQTSAKIIADSVAPNGDRLTTWELWIHRFVLAEFNTHRVFSRNSASSRAIPLPTFIDRATNDPAFPIEWPSEQPGMQGGEPLEGEDLHFAQKLFRDFQGETLTLIRNYVEDTKARHPGLDDKELKPYLLHKSVINRLLEPIMWHGIIVTATEFENFYRQRSSPLAQPEIRVASEAMEALKDSTPIELREGEWHLPYLSPDERERLLQQGGWRLAKAVSTARCARVSYLTHDGKRDFEQDVRLHDSLVTASPPHWSPLEHVATPWPENAFLYMEDGREVAVPIVGNLLGFRQYRHEGAELLGLR